VPLKVIGRTVLQIVGTLKDTLMGRAIEGAVIK